MSESNSENPEIYGKRTILHSSIWIREILLAGALVTLLLGSMWVSTGSFPPMVVVESRSMMHEPEGSVGAIDPGDLIMVMSKERVEIVTFAESMESGNENFGHESHGMPGDVIIFKKNGGNDTPVIHRAILEAVENGSGWGVPGTNLRNVDNITLNLDYECSYHGGSYNLRVDGWVPKHAGFLTSGDNNYGGCMIDQRYANSQSPGGGLVDENGNPVLAIKEDWIVGVASSEIPWVGSIKLLTSGTSDSVPGKSWAYLTATILLILSFPMVIESATERFSISEEEE